MKAVAYDIDGEVTRFLTGAEDFSAWLGAVLAGRKDFHCERLTVLYQSGQTCVFKRKTQ